MEDQKKSKIEQHISLDRIIIDEDAFQHRDIEATGWQEAKLRADQDDHVKALKQDLKLRGELAPVTVMEDEAHPDKYYLLDGHHRMYAYHSHYADKTAKIPSTILKGYSRTEAVEETFRENSRDKWNMTTGQKIEHIWKMLWRSWSEYEPIGERKLAKRLGIGHTTIGKMKKWIREMTTDDAVAESIGLCRAQDLREILNDPKAFPPRWKETAPRRGFLDHPEIMDIRKKGIRTKAHSSFNGAFKSMYPLIPMEDQEETLNQALSANSPYRAVLLDRGMELTEALRARADEEERGGEYIDEEF